MFLMRSRRKINGESTSISIWSGQCALPEASDGGKLATSSASTRICAKIETAERRVGRWLGRHPAAEPVCSVTALRDEHTGRAN